MTGATSVGGNAYYSGAPVFIPGYWWGACYFDIQILVASLISSNSSYSDEKFQSILVIEEMKSPFVTSGLRYFSNLYSNIFKCYSSSFLNLEWKKCRYPLRAESIHIYQFIGCI